MENIEENVVTKGAQAGDSLQAPSGAAVEDLGGPTPENYRPDDDSAKLKDPSAPDAFVNGIMEGKEWVWEGGLLREQLAEKTKKSINTLVGQRALEEHKLGLFQNFLNNL